MSRDTAMEHLHPVFRQRVQELIRMFTTEDLPFRLFEGFRTPHRQRDLYAQGRTRSGNIITKAQPWGSYHQYGVAGDFVLNIDGQWSWDDSGERGRCWNRLHEFAHRVELETLSWERPHLQLKGLSVRDLRAARYPAGGDDTWVDNLESAIHMWQGVPAAPLVPISTTPRPPLDSAAIGPVDSHDSLGRIAEDSHVFRVIARSGLRLRAGPGASFGVIDTLTNGQLVSVVATSGEWASGGFGGRWPCRWLLPCRISRARRLISMAAPTRPDLTHTPLNDANRMIGRGGVCATSSTAGGGPGPTSG